MRNQLRNRLTWRMPTLLAWRKAALQATVMRGCPRPPESLARGTLSKGLLMNPGELFISCCKSGRGSPNPNGPGSRGGTGAPQSRAKETPGTGTCQRGRPELAGKGEEQSYEPIVPAKVGNRRAPETGGHGTHWREGVNRQTYWLRETSWYAETEERCQHNSID